VRPLEPDRPHPPVVGERLDVGRRHLAVVAEADDRTAVAATRRRQAARALGARVAAPRWPARLRTAPAQAGKLPG
jgi:hypothetical protein